MVYDGNGEKSSANGSWLFIQKSFLIANNISFKIQDSLFTVEIVQNK